jgi:hypothetical protein
MSVDAGLGSVHRPTGAPHAAVAAALTALGWLMLGAALMCLMTGRRRRTAG